MGNMLSHLTTISDFDYQSQIETYTGIRYAERIEDPDATFPDLGPVMSSLVGSTDGKPAVNLQNGFKWNDNENKYDVWSVFLKGLSFAGEDSPFVQTRAFRTQEGTKSGYAERKDGFVDRFEYIAMNYGEMQRLAIDCGRGFIKLGLTPGQAISIFATNCPEWIVYLLGLYTQNMTAVPLYPTLGAGSVEYILDLVESECLTVSLENMPKVMKMLEKAPQVAEKLKNIILLDSILDGRFGNTLHVVNNDIKKELKDKYNINYIGLSEVLASGAEAGETIPLHPAEADSNAFIMFTSGTSGNPKGAQLTHRNISSCMGCVFRIVDLPPKTRMFLYLPLQHVFSVVLLGVAILVGGVVSFSQPDVKHLVSDMILCKPNILPTVPRVFVKAFQSIMAAVAAMPFYKRWYIMRAYNYQLNQARQGLPLDEGYDQAVFQQFREKLGLTECKIIVTGGAPCPAYIYEFMKLLIPKGWAISGYGSTESTAGVSITLEGDPTVGTIGSVVPSLHYRLADVPDLEYFHKDGKGELLLHGYTVFPGYFKNDEENEKAFVTDEKGRKWFRTGDVARINPSNNSLSIIDRKKQLLKLSQGEYVSLERLVNTYTASPYINQAFIYGSPYKSCMVAIISPVTSELYNFAKSAGLWRIDEVPVTGSLSPAVIAEFKRIGHDHQQQLVAWMKPSLVACESQLNSFEKIRAVMVETRFADVLGQAWNEANEMMTPTFKLRYNALSKRYIEDLKRLYESAGEPSNPTDIWF